MESTNFEIVTYYNHVVDKKSFSGEFDLVLVMESQHYDDSSIDFLVSSPKSSRKVFLTSEMFYDYSMIHPALTPCATDEGTSNYCFRGLLRAVELYRGGSHDSEEHAMTRICGKLQEQLVRDTSSQAIVLVADDASRDFLLQFHASMRNRTAQCTLGHYPLDIDAFSVGTIRCLIAIPEDIPQLYSSRRENHRILVLGSRFESKIVVTEFLAIATEPQVGKLYGMNDSAIIIADEFFGPNQERLIGWKLNIYPKIDGPARFSDDSSSCGAVTPEKPSEQTDDASSWCGAVSEKQ